jgi:hypothetical protein
MLEVFFDGWDSWKLIKFIAHLGVSISCAASENFCNYYLEKALKIVVG